MHGMEMRKDSKLEWILQLSELDDVHYLINNALKIKYLKRLNIVENEEKKGLF